MGGCLDDLGILLLVYYGFYVFYPVGARPVRISLRPAYPCGLPSSCKAGEAGLAPDMEGRVKIEGWALAVAFAPVAVPGQAGGQEWAK